MKRLFLFVILILILTGCTNLKEVYKDSSGNIIAVDSSGDIVMIEGENQNKSLIIGTVFEYFWNDEGNVGIIKSPILLIFTPSMFEESLLVDFEIFDENKLIAFSRNHEINAPMAQVEVGFITPEYGEENPLPIIDVTKKGPYKLVITAHKDNNFVGGRDIIFVMDQEAYVETREY